METLFKQKLFSKSIRTKMFSDMLKQQRRIGLREFSKYIGISSATLCRLEKGSIPDIETYLKICKWLVESPNKFYNK